MKIECQFCNDTNVEYLHVTSLKKGIETHALCHKHSVKLLNIITRNDAGHEVVKAERILALFINK